MSDDIASSMASEASSEPSEASSPWEEDLAKDEPKSEPEAQPKPSTKERAEPKDEKPEEPKPKQPKLRKIKVGDAEELVDEDELVRDYQKFRGAEKKFREAAETQKKIEAFMEKLQADPLAVLNDSRIPLNRRKLAEDWLLQELEAEMLTPEQRRLKELEQKTQTYEEQLKAQQEAQAQAEREQALEMKRQELAQTFQKAMQATELSKDPEVATEALREMALLARAAKEQGLAVTPEELAERVNLKYYKASHRLLNSMSGEDAIEFLGPEIVKKINKAVIAKHKSQPAQTHKDDSWQVQSKPTTPKRIDPHSAKEDIRKKLGLS